MFHLSCVFLLMTLSRFGAERGGQKVDGMWYCGFARSFETGKYYPASVVFENNHANVRLASGRKLELTMDEETIEDPEEVVAADQRGLWWSLSVDGLDEHANCSETLLSAESPSVNAARTLDAMAAVLIVVVCEVARVC